MRNSDCKNFFARNSKKNLLKLDIFIFTIQITVFQLYVENSKYIFVGGCIDKY